MSSLPLKTILKTDSTAIVSCEFSETIQNCQEIREIFTFYSCLKSSITCMAMFRKVVLLEIWRNLQIATVLKRALNQIFSRYLENFRKSPGRTMYTLFYVRILFIRILKLRFKNDLRIQLQLSFLYRENIFSVSL